MQPLPPNLPITSREENKAEERCPRCGRHVRRLGLINGKTNEVTEKGFACQNPKCSARVLEKYMRNGIPALREKALPTADCLKRVAALKANVQKIEAEIAETGKIGGAGAILEEP